MEESSAQLEDAMAVFVRYVKPVTPIERIPSYQKNLSPGLSIILIPSITLLVCDSEFNIAIQAYFNVYSLIPCLCAM